MFARLYPSHQIRCASSVIIMVLCILLPIPAQAHTGISREVTGPIAISATRIPLTFEPNRGQTDRRVRHLTHGNGYELFLADSEALLALSPAHQRMRAKQTSAAATHEAPDETSIIRMQLKGARTAAIRGESRLTGTVNYITGSDPLKWQTGIETYASVRYAGVYPGVDLIYYGNEGQLEFDFVVAPSLVHHAIGMHNLNEQVRALLTIADKWGCPKKRPREPSTKTSICVTADRYAKACSVRS